jgi:hypothetical protein
MLGTKMRIAAVISTIGFLMPIPGLAASIQWSNLPPGLLDKRTVYNVTPGVKPGLKHSFAWGSLANGLRVSADTTSTVAGPPGAHADGTWVDISTRDFQLIATKPKETTATVNLNASLINKLEAMPAVRGHVYAAVSGFAEVLLNNTVVMKVDFPYESNGGRALVKVDRKGHAKQVLAIGVDYTLKVELMTRADVR